MSEWGIGELVENRWEIRRTFDEGGCGFVYEVFDLSFDGNSQSKHSGM